MDSNKKQTAVEWLAEKYNHVTWLRNRDEISAGIADEWRKHYLEQAKELEKQQIIDAANQIIFNDEDGFGICETITKGEQYYNETYGGNNG